MAAVEAKSLLEEKALVTHKPDQDLVLREKGVMNVAVSHAPSEVTAAKMDVVGHLPGVRGGDWKQVCDFLLLRNCGDVDRAVFIELKKTLSESSKKKGMNQLRRSLPVLEYLRSMWKIQVGSKVNLPGLEVRYFLIAAKKDSRIDKQKIRPQTSSGKEKFPDIEVRTLIGPRVEFDFLLNGK